MARREVVGLTRDEVAAVRAPIDRALTLPARAFLSEEFFQLELERVFRRHWTGLCFELLVPGIGDMHPLEAFGIPLLVIRGDDGQIRVFHNICPYDGSLAVLEPRQGASEIEVLYHGWRYDLRGRLVAIPYWDGTPEGHLDALQGHKGDLVEVRSATRIGIVFVDLGGRAGDLDAYLAPLNNLLSDYDLTKVVQVEDDEVFARQGRTLRTNWKTYLENAAINILHEAFTHETYRQSPEVPRVRDGRRTYFVVTDGPLIAFGYDLKEVARTYASGGHMPHLGRRQETPPDRGYFITYYPNLVMPIRPPMLRINIVLPESPGLTRLFHCSHFHPTAPAHPDFKPYHEALVPRYRQVYREDGLAVESVQRARRSPVWQRHFYAPFWDDLHYALNNLVVDDLVGSRHRGRTRTRGSTKRSRSLSLKQ